LVLKYEPVQIHSKSFIASQKRFAHCDLCFLLSLSLETPGSIKVESFIREVAIFDVVMFLGFSGMEK